MLIEPPKFKVGQTVIVKCSGKKDLVVCSSYQIRKSGTEWRYQVKGSDIFFRESGLTKEIHDE